MSIRSSVGLVQRENLRGYTSRDTVPLMATFFRVSTWKLPCSSACTMQWVSPRPKDTWWESQQLCPWHSTLSGIWSRNSQTHVIKEFSNSFEQGVLKLIWSRSSQTYLSKKFSNSFDQGVLKLIWSRSSQTHLIKDFLNSFDQGVLKLIWSRSSKTHLIKEF